MVAFFRQFLVIVLVLLQSATPLVHAHSGGETLQSGIHLSEFESMFFRAEAWAMAACRHIPKAESAIVNVGSAIKPFGAKTYPLLTPDQLTITANLPSPGKLSGEIITHPSLPETLAFPAFPNPHPTRAPPLLKSKL